jgi:hypothetical protein
MNQSRAVTVEADKNSKILIKIFLKIIEIASLDTFIIKT